MVRIAVVQTDPHLGAKAHNLEVFEHSFAESVAGGAECVIFPECMLTGYMFGSLAEALLTAEPVPGPSSERVSQFTARHGAYAVVGMLERVDNRCYNTAILAGPNGIEAVYRKTHTLCLGVDRFTSPGDLGLRVHDLPFGRIGILICYDLRFPEPSRVLAMRGAQAIVLPTNWPVSSTIQPDVFTRARAAENRVFVLAADRIGTERGAVFLGRSQIVSPSGDVLAEASRTDAEILMADINLDEADSKRVVVSAGEHEMDCFLDRRPDLYDGLFHGPRPAQTR